MQWTMNPWRVDKYNLALGIILHAQDAMPGGLGFIRHDGKLFPDDAVQKR
jgi:hypothetical protein